MSAFEGPQKMGDLLSNLAVIRWMRAWKRCVGPILLKQTRFRGVYPVKGVRCVHVDVPDPVWRQELQFQKDEILKRFHQALEMEQIPKGDWPEDISLGPVSAMPFKAGNSKQSRNK